MKTRSLVCDWYGDNASATPVVIILRMPDDYEYRFMDDCPELWSAFLELFGGDQGYDIDPEMCPSEYIYQVLAVDIDLSKFEGVSDAQWLYVEIPERGAENGV